LFYPHPVNIRLGWKGLPGANTQAYYKDLQNCRSNIGSCGLYYKSFMIINYDHKVRSKLWRHLFMTLELQLTIVANVIYSFIVMATVINIVNYDCTVITIVNYDPKTFIVQATGYRRMSETNTLGFSSRKSVTNKIKSFYNIDTRCQLKSFKKIKKC
jgi:hypothetical protein